MENQKDCIFCKIAKREINSNLLFENDRIVAFNDLNPQAPMHFLVIPKKHITGINAVNDSDKALLGEIQIVIRDLAKKYCNNTGYRVLTNCGIEAGQTVIHLHYHVLGGRDFSWPPG
ncbi:histidine triad nucleotide-binding protein [Elusimicrobiota bacterium]